MSEPYGRRTSCQGLTYIIPHESHRRHTAIDDKSRYCTAVVGRMSGAVSDGMAFMNVPSAV